MVIVYDAPAEIARADDRDVVCEVLVLVRVQEAVAEARLADSRSPALGLRSRHAHHGNVVDLLWLLTRHCSVVLASLLSLQGFFLRCYASRVSVVFEWASHRPDEHNHWLSVTLRLPGLLEDLRASCTKHGRSTTLSI